MTPRVTLRRSRSLALATGLVLSLGFFATSGSSTAEDRIAADAGGNSPGSDHAQPPATYFSINAVLAKVDAQRGRGPGAVRLAAINPSNTATDAAPAVREAPAAGSEPFGLVTFRAPDGLLWRKWRGIEAAMAREQAVIDQCRSDAANCPAHAAQFLRLVGVLGEKSGREKLDEANRGVNTAIRYVSDQAQHGETDRWTAPLATYATAKGDCEDYAIAKYVALTAAGFSRNDLQLVLVRDRAVRQDHAVLAARLDGRWLMLDNRFANLMEDADAARFTPLFAIDHNGVHLFATPYANSGRPAGQVEAAPALAGAEWSGKDNASYRASQLGTASLPM
ncbi:transglutaminase-like cysteine peptidase [Bradyrhizobium sp.]|uniref:transglutaminase-like cysteine peptidase n=1 Tax=Bradyrhizobium sp. TaxID=376 RepID=UPI0025BC1B77|nr:transglutaminase-like cysteine peptidase [Bradyrhizobium sp.]